MLAGLSLEIHQSETLALVGPGGSGKSTLLQGLDHMITTLDTGNPIPSNAPKLWTSGHSHFEVRSCTRLTQHGDHSTELLSTRLHAAGVDVRADDHWLPDDANARRAFYAALAHPMFAAPDPIRRYASFLLTLNSAAELLLFDEPAFALPEPWSSTVSDLLGRLHHQRRASVVLITHYLPLARQVADRVALLVDGELIEVAPAEEFFARPRHPRTRQFIEWGA